MVAISASTMKAPGLFARLLGLPLIWPQIADAQEPGWLSWTAPPECPSAHDIEQRVGAWLGGAPSRASDLTVETALRWTEQKWEVTVDITLAGHSGTRRILVDTCQDAADFVAVAVVLAVDPARAERWSSDEPVEAPEPQPTRAADLDLDERDGAHAGDESTTMIAEPWQAGADPPSRFDSGA